MSMHGDDQEIPEPPASRDVRRTLTAYLREKAGWRLEKEAEYPDDPRNARSAESLQALADYVEHLPEEDEIVRGLAWAQAGYDADVYLPSTEARDMIAQFGFHHPETDMHGFLKDLLSAEVTGAQGAIDIETGDYE